MKVLAIKSNNQITSMDIYTQKSSEITANDMKRWISGSIEIVYATKISRLAYLYIMFVEKDAKHRPVNRLASLLLNEGEGVVRGDAIIARTDKFATTAKTFALDEDEAKDIVERISKLAKSKLGL